MNGAEALLVVGAIALATFLFTNYAKNIDNRSSEPVLRAPAVPLDYDYPQRLSSVSTRGCTGPPRRVGYVSCDVDGKKKMLPLVENSIDARRDRYNYMVQSDEGYGLPLPAFFEGRDCSEEVGCRQLYTKDTVKVPALSEDEWSVYRYDR